MNSNWITELARPEIVSMKAYSSARSEAAARGVLLNANEMPVSLLDTADEIHGRTDINRYPEPQPQDVIERFAEIYGVPTTQLLVTRGSDEGIDLLVRVFCRSGENAILECPPGFGMYRIAAQTQGARVARIERSADDGFAFPLGGVVSALQSDPAISLLFLTSPNNPTGDLIDSASLMTVLEAAAGRAIVVLDEAYIEFCPDRSAISLLGQYEHLVILRTLSKAWAAAGLRCGTVIASPQIIALLRRIIAPYPLAGPVIDQVRAIIAPSRSPRQQEMLAQAANNKQRLVAFLRSLNWLQDLWPGEANFVLIRTPGAMDLLTHCSDRGVVLRGYASEPLLENCLRITVGSGADLEELERALQSWTPPSDLPSDSRGSGRS